MSLQHATPLHLLMLGALGVVFGDIGTSPLYAFREALSHVDLALTPPVVMGILSMIFWALVIVVTLQYVVFVLRADNRGEGGIFALTTLAFSQLDNPKWNPAILMLGLLGGALFFGDAIITPAISVLSAVEGLKVTTPVFEPYVVPIALGVIAGVFALQRLGTGHMGALFGPVILVWFGVLAILGVRQILQYPEILWALNPLYAVSLWQTHPVHAFIVLGSVVLAITGAEALYADMGHFGRRAIRATWLFFVLPALVLNYFGQGALVLNNPHAVGNPFFMMTPEAYRLPMVVLATMATVIACQAVISGAFALASQAIQLGYLPRISIKHTSAQHVAQVYLPGLNWLMLFLVTILVLVFQSSGALAGAYGVAVVGTIVITTILTSIVLVRRLGWSKMDGWLFLAGFLALNLTLFAAVTPKISHGGWFPILFGALVFYAMHTWVRGRQVATDHHKRYSPMLDSFSANPPAANRPARTAVFLTSDLNYVPPALMYNLAHNCVIHAQVILLKVARARIPRYPEGERVRVQFLKNGFVTVSSNYGFMEQPDIPGILRRCAEDYGLHLDYPEAVSYFLGQHTYVPSGPHIGLSKWQEPLFVFLNNITTSPAAYFRIPKAQVIEIGAQVEI